LHPEGRRFEPLAAVGNKNPDIITTLLKAGADIEAQDKDGCTPLMYASLDNQNLQAITALLKAGSDIEARELLPGRFAS
jgi:ankyrin repeat protein